MKRHRRLIVLSLALMAAPLLFAVLSRAAGPEPPSPYLEPPKPNTTCVLPREGMRYEHMKHLRSLRDEVLRDGKRAQVEGARAQGITSCRSCHAHRAEFCDRCHERASVRLDCFGCHAY
jgi:hypothetical protein